MNMDCNWSLGHPNDRECPDTKQAHEVCVSTCRGIHLSFMTSSVHGVPWIYAHMYSKLQNTVVAKYRFTGFFTAARP